MDEFQQQLASIGISNVPLVHAILVQQDISSLEQLNDVESIQDLIQLNIPPQDAERLFKVSVKGSKAPNPSFTSKEEWLREAGLSEYAELRKIPLDGYRFLHKDDLTAELNFTLGKRNEVWRKLSQAIPLITQQFRPKFIGDNKAEIITIEPESSNRLAINHENWMTFMEAASANKCMLKIALVGPTGVGKSRLISELMPFQKRVLELKIPGVAAPGAVSPTTGNICLYLGEIKGAEVMLIDVEGMNGKTPESCKQRFALHKKELKELQEGRQKMVSTLFPQLVYLCANVIIYVDSARLHNSSYVERIEDFAAKSTITEGSGEKPKLLVVQNFANPSQQTDLSAYEVEASTSDFFTANKESGVIEKITMYYQGVKVVKMPEYQVDPQLYEEQLSRLKVCLMNCLHETASTSWMMKKNNFFSDKLWFEYLKAVVEQLSKDDKSKVSIREVLKRLWTPHNDAVKALKGFWDLISRKEIANEVDYSTIVGLALQRLAVITLSALQETAHGGIKVEDLTKENLKQIIDQNFESFSALVTEWSPCLFGVRGRICGIPKCFHTSGHRTLRGSLSGVPNRPVPATPELPQFDFVVLRRQFDGFLQDYLNEVSGTGRKITIGVGRRSSFERSTFKRSINNLGLKILQEAKDKNLIVIERQGDSIEWSQCMICLAQFKGTTVSLMKCGHQYCKECGSKLHVCPLDGLASKEVDFSKRIPTLAGTRLLSLDGGGVRGIILVLVLQKLEVLTGFKIQDLFDYIIGTSVGGILALSLADRNVDLVSYLEFYEKMPKKIFNTGLGRKLLFWLPKYHVTDLQNAMYDNFRQRTFLEAVESAPLVAATTYDSNLNTPTPTLLANYFQYRHGESKVQIYYDLPMYKGATATAAAPTYFGSYTVAGKRFVDGGVVANNPAALGVDEMKSIWPNHPVDVVLSVGTGVTQDDTKASDDLVYWVKKFVSLATSPQNVHMKLSNTHGLNYFRVNPLLSKRIGLDTTDDKKLNQLVQDTMNYLVAPENLTHLKTIGKNLVSKLLYIDAPKELAMNNPPTILPIVNRAKVPFNQQRFGKYRLTCEVSGRRRNVISKLSFYETGDRVGDLSIAVESPEVLTINVFIHFNNDNDKYHISGSPATVTFYQNHRQPLPSK